MDNNIIQDDKEMRNKFVLDKVQEYMSKKLGLPFKLKNIDIDNCPFDYVAEDNSCLFHIIRFNRKITTLTPVDIKFLKYNAPCNIIDNKLFAFEFTDGIYFYHFKPREIMFEFKYNDKSKDSDYFLVMMKFLILIF